MRYAAILCLALPVVGGAAFAADAPTPETALAALNFGADWKLDGDVKQYLADDLYTYIDGEAEFFFPYGFDHCWSARYAKKDSDLALVIDAYHLRSTLDAYGVYASFRRSDAAAMAAGTEGCLTESLCLFFQDSFFVQIAVSGASEMQADVFTACAKAVAATLPPGEVPKELAMLHVDGVVKGSERYLPKSLLGYPFFPRGLMADAEWDNLKGRIFIVLADSEEKAAAVLEDYAGYLQKPNSGAVIRRDKDSLTADDRMYKAVSLKRVGSRVLGVINDEDPDKNAPMMAKLEAAAK